MCERHSAGFEWPSSFCGAGFRTCAAECYFNFFDLIWRDVEALPYAVLVTGIVQCAAHIIALKKTGAVPAVAWKGNEHVDELGKAFLPTVLATGVFQLNVLLDNFIVYLMVRGEGKRRGCLFFGNRLLVIPMALVGHGVSTALYPE